MPPKRPFPAYRGPASYVFVCYAHSDAGTVYPDLVALHDSGVNFWYDEGIEAGHEWRTEIAEALNRAAILLFYQSGASVSSKHCVRELGYALDRDIPILRVDLDGTALPSGLKLALHAEQAIDPGQYSRRAYLEKLQGALASRVKPPEEPSTAALVAVGARKPVSRGTIVTGAVAIGALALAAVSWFFTPEPAPKPARELVKVMSSTAPVSFPNISPDGTTLAFIRNGDVFIRRVGGGQEVQLTETEEVESGPVFSPDGERIAFSRFSLGSGVSDIYVIPTFGGEARPLVRHAMDASWSHDGRHLVYLAVKKTDALRRSLRIMTVDGRESRTVLEPNDPGYFPYLPVLSPDGSTIAFVRSMGGASAEIWLVGADGTDLRRLSQNIAGIIESDPLFTSDGGAIVHTSNRGGATNIWRTRLADGSSEQLTAGAGPDNAISRTMDGSIAFLNSRWRQSLLRYEAGSDDAEELHSHLHFIWAPAVAPDSASIAFSQAEPDGSWNIWRLTPADGSLLRLTSGDVPQIYPRFTPDSLHVVYFEWRAGSNRVWKVPVDGGPAEPLTPAEVDASYADVSPDGRTLAFVVTQGNETRIHVKPMAGGDSRQLAQITATLPRWSPDGRSIAFAKDRSWENGIFLVRADGTESRRLTEKGSFPTWWPDGSRIGFLAYGPRQQQQIQTVSIETGALSVLEEIQYHATNNPFDVGRDGSIVTSDVTPLAHEVWLLKASP